MSIVTKYDRDMNPHKKAKKMANKMAHKALMRDLARHGFGNVRTSSLKGKSIAEMAK